jgi:hypothetical protein
MLKDIVTSLASDIHAEYIPGQMDDYLIFDHAN